MKQEHLLNELRAAKDRLNAPCDCSEQQEVLSSDSKQQEVLSSDSKQQEVLLPDSKQQEVAHYMWSPWPFILAGVGVGLGLLVMGCDGTQAEIADVVVGGPVALQAAECQATTPSIWSDHV